MFTVELLWKLLVLIFVHIALEALQRALEALGGNGGTFSGTIRLVIKLGDMCRSG